MTAPNHDVMFLYLACMKIACKILNKAEHLILKYLDIFRYFCSDVIKYIYFVCA